MSAGAVLAAIYVVGVLWGLLLSDAGPAERVTIALLWPVGPIAFATTVAILLVALPIAFPRVGIPLWMVAGAAGWIWLIR